MKHEILERFQHIDTLIQEHKTGTPAALAQTVGVSKRTIYKYIRVMKNIGAPIAFNAPAKAYYYKIEGRFICTFSFSANIDTHQRASQDNLKSRVISREEFLIKTFMNVILNKN